MEQKLKATKSKRKKKGAFFYKGGQNAKKRGIQPGMKGILVTCVRGKEKFAVIEATNLFNEYIEQIIEEQKANGTYKEEEEEEEEADAEDGSGSESEEDEDADGDQEDEDGGPARKKPKLTAEVADSSDNEAGEEVDFRAAFEKEMKQLKEKDPTKRLTSNVFIDMECVLFIRMHSSVDPVEVIRRIFVDAETTKKAKTRHCTRFTPVEAVCHADLDSFEKLRGPVFDKYFHQPQQKPRTFCVQYTSRNHAGGIEREGAIKKIASMVGPPHTVDLKNAELNIMVEVMGGICCVGVVPDYKRFFKYNIVSVLGIKTSSNVLLIKKMEDKKEGQEKTEQIAPPAEKNTTETKKEGPE